MKSTLILIFLFLSVVVVNAARAPSVVESEVFRTLRAKKHVDVFVQLPLYKWDMDSLANLSREDRLWHVYNTLRSFTDNEQSSIREVLTGQGFEFTSFWIANVIQVRNANRALVSTLVKRFPQIVSIHLERRIPAPSPLAPSNNLTRSSSVEWGVDMVEAPAVWELGYDGTGVVVANIDTGVRVTHVTLNANYRGTISGSSDYNWYQNGRGTVPSDVGGHGSHTMGTIAGSRASGIGVAPGSLWIAARGCGKMFCSNSNLLGSGEFLACPTRLNGLEPDCSKAPHVINNSWGGGNGDLWYQGIITSWLAAGIIPIFSAGNAGPGCRTANSPGDNYNVISVAASSSTDALADFSSRGPARALAGIGTQKPDITAPGVDVRSAWSSGDRSFNIISGTSMAAPHVTGVVALMLQANPNLTYEQIYSIITSNADTSSLLVPEGSSRACGGKPWNVFPNFHYGYGRINALRCVRAALALAS